MNLVDLDVGKWIYLAIYLFFPLITLVYLIRTFGLEVEENVAESVRYHIEQADYWVEIALNTAQSKAGTKSLASLVHTVQWNLDEAARLLETAVIPTEQRRYLNRAYKAVQNKLTHIQKPHPSTPLSCTVAAPR
ncbi:MAG: hypothetical protein P8183_21885 [Anaerolineae bacterium]